MGQTDGYKMKNHVSCKLFGFFTHPNYILLVKSYSIIELLSLRSYLVLLLDNMSAFESFHCQYSLTRICCKLV